MLTTTSSNSCWFCFVCIPWYTSYVVLIILFEALWAAMPTLPDLKIKFTVSPFVPTNYSNIVFLLLQESQSEQAIQICTSTLNLVSINILYRMKW